MRRGTKRAHFALACCVGAFCVAMGLREQVNVWIGTGAAAVVSLLLLWVLARPSVESLFEKPAPRNVVMGIGVGIAMSFATWWLYPLSVTVLPLIEGEVEMLYGLLRQPPGPVRAFPLLVFVVAAEELVWRGLAIDVFSNYLGRWPAVLVSALLYVLPQVAFRSPLLMIVALLCGLLWGFLRISCKGLAAPLTAHLIWNVLVFIAYPVA